MGLRLVWWKDDPVDALVARGFRVSPPGRGYRVSTSRAWPDEASWSLSPAKTAV